MSEKGFEEGAVPGEKDSGDKTREGEQGERGDCDIRIKLGNQCAKASKENGKEPNGEEATEESSFSDHLAHPHLGNSISIKTLITSVTLSIFAMPRLAERIEVMKETRNNVEFFEPGAPMKPMIALLFIVVALLSSILINM